MFPKVAFFVLLAITAAQFHRQFLVVESIVADTLGTDRLLEMARFKASFGLLSASDYAHFPFFLLKPFYGNAFILNQYANLKFIN